MRLLIALLLLLSLPFAARGQETPGDPNDPLVLSSVRIRVVAIKFNHVDPPQLPHRGPYVDGENLRFSHQADLEHNKDGKGEWREGLRSEPALYVGSSTDRATVLVKLVTVPPATGTAVVRADPGTGNLIPLQERPVRFVQGVSVGANGSPFVEFSYQQPFGAAVDVRQGEWQWLSGSKRLCSTGTHKCYVVLAFPTSPWYTQNREVHDPWASALDFAIDDAITRGSTATGAAMRALTTHVFAAMSLRYDHVKGAGRYCAPQGSPPPIYAPLRATPFGLTGFLQATPGSVVACTDTAAAVATLGSVLGVEADMQWWVAPPRFGYLNPVTFIGGTVCNNPFFNHYEVVDDPLLCEFVANPCQSNALHHQRVRTPAGWRQWARSYFGNHANCTVGGAVYDACVGPFLEVPRQAFLTQAIDQTTPGEAIMSAMARGAAPVLVELSLK